MKTFAMTGMKVQKTITMKIKITKNDDGFNDDNNSKDYDGDY